MAVLKAGAVPLEGPATFLEPFGALVRRSESKHASERYTTGLLSESFPQDRDADGSCAAGHQ